MNWFEKLLPPKIKANQRRGKRGVPEGLWEQCKACQAMLYQAELERNLYVCPKCGHHMRLSARARLNAFFDDVNKIEIGERLRPNDVLRFRDSKKYRDRLVEARKSTGEEEALLAMSGEVKELPMVAVAFEFGFMGGSMGSVVGERFVRAVQLALDQRLPFVCFAASGGARMQEALFSLMQMAKTSLVLAMLAEAQLPYISVLTDPTMGGVSASLAMLGDIIIAEPKALVGFAGPRVIEQTVHEVLPEGFQRSEFLLEHGAIDMILDRRKMRDEIHFLVSTLLRKQASQDG